jgi:hypothetical protein
MSNTAKNRKAEDIAIRYQLPGENSSPPLKITAAPVTSDTTPAGQTGSATLRKHPPPLKHRPGSRR